MKEGEYFYRSLGKNLQVLRTHHSASLIKDGRIVIIGGKTKTKEVQIFDPRVKGEETLFGLKCTGNSPGYRYNHQSCCEKETGFVFVFGGRGNWKSYDLVNASDMYKRYLFHLNDLFILKIGKDPILNTDLGIW